MENIFKSYYIDHYGAMVDKSTELYLYYPGKKNNPPTPLKPRTKEVTCKECPDGFYAINGECVEFTYNPEEWLVYREHENIISEGKWTVELLNKNSIALRDENGLLILRDSFPDLKKIIEVKGNYYVTYRGGTFHMINFKKTYEYLKEKTKENTHWPML